MILEHDDYRHFLKCELADRIAKNSAYSLRAFAKQLGLAPTSMSQLLSGKRNLSSETCLGIASKLGLSPLETEYFQLLVQLESTKKPELKAHLNDRISAIKPNRKITDLSFELFKVISDWHHFAILKMTEIPNLVFTAGNISKRLGIHKFEAETAIRRLLELELLEQDPKNPTRYRRSKGDLFFASPVPNTALRKHHKQVYERAIESLETQSPQEKFIGSEFVAIAQSDLKKVSEFAEEFFSKVLALSKKSKSKSHVYNVGVHAFNLMHEKERMK